MDFLSTSSLMTALPISFNNIKPYLPFLFFLSFDNIDKIFSLFNFGKSGNGNLPMVSANNSWLFWFNPENFNDNLYIEIQRLGKNHEILDEYCLLSMAYDNRLPLVATNDVFFERIYTYRFR